MRFSKFNSFRSGLIDNKPKSILPTSYFPSIEYFLYFTDNKEVVLDDTENYSKQSLRNRANIYSANGKLSLSIPIKKNTDKNIQKTEIDYSLDWQKNHNKAILSAYNSAPFYQFFIDEFNFVFYKKHKYLLELNLKILEKLLNIYKQNTKINFASEFKKNDENKQLYNLVSKINNNFYHEKYCQVFQEKHGFINNLSILDYLFNEGNFLE